MIELNFKSAGLAHAVDHKPDVGRCAAPQKLSHFSKPNAVSFSARHQPHGDGQFTQFGLRHRAAQFLK